MKSLFKISSRYVMTAILIAFLVLLANIAGTAWFISQTARQSINAGMGREQMSAIENEMTVAEDHCVLSEKGYTLLADSVCVWAMRLNASGDVVWSYQLPEKLNHRYSLNEVAIFSRWYLDDYPVFMWTGSDGLMVYGANKDIARFDFYGSINFYGQLPKLFYLLILLNLILMAGLALFFGFRFYRSLCPIADGIEKLSEKEAIHLSEKGIIGDLARQLNQTSTLLQTQDQQLQQRDQARTEWIAGVSHDVRTPLSLIMGYSDDLADASELSDENHMKADTIRTQSQIISNLIADLNLTVKLTYQSQPLRCESLSPARLLRASIAEFYNQPIDESFQIIPVIEREAEKVVILGDRQLLLRTFRNLIGNSIRHNPNGCNVNITMSSDDSCVYIRFADSGAGISNGVIAILEGIEPEKPEVHIMGLRIVIQIIKAHDGHVNFLRRETGGNDLCICLPVKSY